MKNLRLMALILGVALTTFGTDIALAESERKATQEAPAAGVSAGKASSEQRSRAAGEDFMRQIGKAIFDRQDSNKDGKVSHDEFMAPYEKQFRETDANNDGFWTMEEWIDSYTKKSPRPFGN